MMIVTQTYARAGLLGNPSDGYYGRTISFTLKNFTARVTLTESAELVIAPRPVDQNVFRDIAHLRETVSSQGYYGGARLVKAAVKHFADDCTRQGITLPGRNCTLEYDTTIPRQVGLAGSSAIITATMKALQQFYEVEIPKERLPTLILETETVELGITAGLQDRVVQVYEGCVYMDFEREIVEKSGHGHYEQLDPALLPSLWLAWRPDYRKVSGGMLSGLRERFDRGDRLTIETLAEIADLAREGRDALLARDTDQLARLMNRNFDLRRRIMPVDSGDLHLIETARGLGAAAKLTGSGGAVLGLCPSGTAVEECVETLRRLGAEVTIPGVI